MGKLVDLPNKIYDASTISDFLRCPRYGYYRHIKRIIPIADEAPLRFGAIFHQALDAWHAKEGTPEVKLANAVKICESVPRNLDDDARTPETATRIIKEYAAHYAKEPWELLDSECEFTIDMGQDRMYVGRIDKNIKWNSGFIYVLDHKTTKILGSSFFSQFRPSVQMTGYAYACRELFGSCSGIVIDAISLATKPKDRFLRDISPRLPQEYTSWEKNFHLWCAGIEGYISRDEYPCHYNLCNMYFHDCCYKQLCTFGEDDTMWNMYKQKGEEEQ